MTIHDLEKIKINLLLEISKLDKQKSNLMCKLHNIQKEIDTSNKKNKKEFLYKNLKNKCSHEKIIDDPEDYTNLSFICLDCGKSFYFGRW